MVYEKQGLICKVIILPKNWVWKTQNPKYCDWGFVDLILVRNLKIFYYEEEYLTQHYPYYIGKYNCPWYSLKDWKFFVLKSVYSWDVRVERFGRLTLVRIVDLQNEPHSLK